MAQRGNLLLIGSIERKPNLNHTTNGTPIIKIDIATNKKGHKQPFMRNSLTLKGSDAIAANNCLSNGSTIYIMSK